MNCAPRFFERGDRLLANPCDQRVALVECAEKFTVAARRNSVAARAAADRRVASSATAAG